MTFLGHPVSYWVELKSRIDQISPAPDMITDLITEVAELRGKVSFYESRIRQMYEFQNHANLQRTVPTDAGPGRG